MPTRAWIPLLAMLGSQVFAQTFDLGLDRLAGPGSTIRFAVARGSHLYSAAFSPTTTVLLRTAEDGSLESKTELEGTIAGFDADESGQVYVLRTPTLVLTLDPEWRVTEARTLLSPVVSLAAVGGRPMGIGADARLDFLDVSEKRFNLDAYPGPRKLFAAGRDRFGVLRPKAWALFFAKLEDGGETTDTAIPAAQDLSLTSAAGSPDGKIYLLGSRAAGTASVVECDEHAHPKFIHDHTLPAWFDAQLLAVTPASLYLIDPRGKVEAIPSNPEPGEGRAIDAFPQRSSDLEPFYRAVGKTGHDGDVLIRFRLSEEGVPQQIRIESPAVLEGVPEVMDAIRAWRFEPAVVGGKVAEVPMEMRICCAR
ncbi:MAG TPA: energy transducer TonB [Bryobacteraceae bacterium]|jgi:TonB family protein